MKGKEFSIDFDKVEKSLGPNNINTYKALSATFWHLTSF